MGHYGSFSGMKQPIQQVSIRPADKGIVGKASIQGNPENPVGLRPISIGGSELLFSPKNVQKLWKRPGTNVLNYSKGKDFSFRLIFKQIVNCII